MYDRNDVDVLARETLYQGYNQVDRVTLRHRLFAGPMGAAILREVVDCRRAVAVLPYDPQRDEVVLIEQFRIGPYVNDDDPWQLEIAAGVIEAGEDPIEAVHREAQEEAGLHLTALESASEFYSSPGVMSEHIAVYCGRVDATRAGGIHGLAEESEDIRVLVMTFDDTMAALAAGRIKASPAVIALQWLALNRERLRREWT